VCVCVHGCVYTCMFMYIYDTEFARIGRKMELSLVM